MQVERAFLGRLKKRTHPVTQSQDVSGLSRDREPHTSRLGRDRMLNRVVLPEPVVKHGAPYERRDVHNDSLKAGTGENIIKDLPQI